VAGQCRDHAKAAERHRPPQLFLRPREFQRAPCGAHELAARATDAYESAREKVRRFLNASAPREIVFVRGATEGINLVAQSWGRHNIHKDDEIVITWLEHHANIVPWQMLCAEKGARLRVAPVDDTGQVILEEYEKLLNPKTRLVSVARFRTPSAPSLRGGDDRGGTPAWRKSAGGWRAGRLAHARRRPGAELRLLRAFRAQDVRAHRHRRGVRQV
jgi:hypothetical protein